MERPWLVDGVRVDFEVADAPCLACGCEGSEGMPNACSRMSDSEGCGSREFTGVAPLAIAVGIGRFDGGVALDS
jgi:hypothetical protein